MALEITIIPLRTYNGADPIASYLSDRQSPWKNRLSNLRSALTKSIVSQGDHANAVGVQNTLEEYQCCLHKILENTPNSPSKIRNLLSQERSSTLWNLASCFTYQASQQKLTNKPGWSRAATQLQTAASLLQHMQQIENSSDLEEKRQLLMAVSQRCVYEGLWAAQKTKKPRHLLLSKLASAGVPLFPQSIPYGKAWSFALQGRAQAHQAALSREKNQCGMEIARLREALRSWKQCWAVCCHSDDPQIDEELRIEAETTLQDLEERLDQAQQENEQIHHQPVPQPNELADIRGEKVVQVDHPLEKLLPSGAAVLQERPLQIPDDLEDGVGELQTAPEKTVPMAISTSSAVSSSAASSSSSSSLPPPPVTASLSPSSPHPQKLPGAGASQHYAKQFQSESQKVWLECSSRAKRYTDEARHKLAHAQLPNSVTSYESRRAHRGATGGGIPDELWHRVEQVQETRRLNQLKQDLWSLRDIAEQSRTQYIQINSQLDDDLESDRLFRQQFPQFQGHDASEVQKTFRQSLRHYDRLLVTAQEGDEILFKRLEILDTTPKYKLLQFQRSQLDRLVPASLGPSAEDISIDTSKLSRLLVELSNLFRERDKLLEDFRQHIDTFDVSHALQSQPEALGNEEASRVFRSTLEPFLQEFERSLGQQEGLLISIFSENDVFQRALAEHDARVPPSSHGNDSCIALMEDALEEIEQLERHLQEGKEFYNGVLPKLEKLRHQVGDVSARLAVERLEYSDKAQMSQQEAADKAMAQRMLNEGGAGNGGNVVNNGHKMEPAVSTGYTVTEHLHAGSLSGGNGASFKVDDEKVAALINMEFDPAKVVAALTKCNNNMDQALNELLSG